MVVRMQEKTMQVFELNQIIELYKFIINEMGEKTWK